MLGGERSEQLAHVAIHDRGDLVQGQINPVIGDTALREVVGADAFGTVARADQVLAGAGDVALLDLRTLDVAAAKIGQLILQGGNWQRRRIISEEWLKTAAEKLVEVPPESGLGYGYHMWMADRPGSSAFNGMLGQNVLIYPDINMVIVTNAGSNELFQRSTLIATIEKYLGAGFEPADPLPENESEYKKLLRIQSALSGEENDAFLQQLKGWSGKILRRSNKPTPSRYVKKLDGMSYALQKKNIGIFPLLLQVVHNNFT